MNLNAVYSKLLWINASAKCLKCDFEKSHKPEVMGGVCSFSCQHYFTILDPNFTSIARNKSIKLNINR